MLRGIVHILEQDIFKGELLPGSQREFARREHQLFQVPLFCDRHQLGAQRIIRCIEGNCQLRPHRFCSKIIDTWHNSRGRYRHPPLRNANSFSQQPHGFNEIIEIQEWLTHAHEDQVHAVFRRRNILVSQNCDHLADDFPGAEVAFDPQQSRKAELAIHRAAYLA